MISSATQKMQNFDIVRLHNMMLSVGTQTFQRALWLPLSSPNPREIMNQSIKLSIILFPA